MKQRLFSTALALVVLTVVSCAQPSDPN